MHLLDPRAVRQVLLVLVHNSGAMAADAPGGETREAVAVQYLATLANRT